MELHGLRALIGGGTFEILYEMKSIYGNEIIPDCFSGRAFILQGGSIPRVQRMLLGSSDLHSFGIAHHLAHQDASHQLRVSQKQDLLLCAAIGQHAPA